MSIPDVLLWGFVATLVLTTVMSASHALAYTRMSIPYMLGAMLTPDRDTASVAGFAMHLVMGWLFALLYAAGFESLGMATWWLGTLGGLVHALVVLVALMPIIPSFHPRMASELRGPEPTRALEPPGALALNYGRRTPIISIVGHLAYGAILGAFYTV